VLNGIDKITNDVDDMIGKQRLERERNEENVLELIEKVIERLRNDIAI
jgi:hypothetical protein